MPLKWKRQKPGVYASTDGKWTVEGEKTSWTLTGTETNMSWLENSKKACQKRAEETLQKTDPPKTPPQRTKKQPSVESGPGVDAALSSLYLEVSGLRFSLERTLRATQAVENALQRVVDPDKTIPRAGQRDAG